MRSSCDYERSWDGRRVGGWCEMAASLGVSCERVDGQ
jgi:hypothetical protein